MDVLITGLIAPQLTEVCGPAGSSHPFVAGLLDDGSHCNVNAVPAGARGLEQLFDAALEAASQAGVPARKIDSLAAPETSEPNGIRVFGKVLDLEEAANVVAPPTGPEALCVLLGDGAERVAPVAILLGRTLPSMGPMPPCLQEDLQATWVRLAGGTPSAGRYLLEETSSAWDPDVEQQLTERLRQLYGD